MTGVLLALTLCLGPGPLAQEPLPTGPSTTESAPDDLPTVVEVRRTNNAYQRKWLRRAGGTSMAMAAIWWLYLGDAWNAGDASTLLGGFGLVAASGAALGGSVAGVYTDETELDWEAGSPTLALTPTIGGSTTVGEKIPYGLKLSFTPRLRVGDGIDLVLAGSVHSDLGWAVELDPRPQGDFSIALQEQHWGFDLAPEFRVNLLPMLQLRVRSQAVVFFDHYVYGGDQGESRLRRAALSPLLAGVSWRVSGRQRFWFVLGPRFDHLSWKTGDDPAWSSADIMLGPLTGEAAYEIHMPDPDWIPGPWEFHRRFRIRYEHSRFDGDGFNTGAMIGFFGPFELRYDVRAKRPEMSWALQGALVVTISDHGGVGLTLGVVPPRKER